MSNKKFGYARVSTAEQNEDRQVLELLEYGIEERDIYVDKQSGRSFERTNYMSLRNSILRNGDILVVKSIDRFGRNYSGMPDREAVILEDITGEGVLAELHPIQFKEDVDI